MAKKRLNKKVAIIGSAILAVFLLGVIVVFLNLSKDPQKFLEDARKLVEQNNYESAQQNYGKALGAAKKDELKIDILFEIADFHRINNEMHEADWPKALACWNRIKTIDTKNIKARSELVKFFYEMGDSGNNNVWKQIETEASELLEVLNEKGEPVDPYVLKAQARAKLTIARLGQITNRENYTKDSISDFEKLITLAPDDIEAYDLLSQAIMLKGQLEADKGITDAMEKAFVKAQEVLEKIVEIKPDDADAHLNLLKLKFNAAAGDKEQSDAVIAEMEKLTDKFGKNAAVHANLVSFYRADIKTLDKAINSIEKAISLDKENVEYAITASVLYYRKGSINQNQQLINKAIETATQALTFPDCQVTTGPRQFSHRIFRFGLYNLLSQYYIDLALDAMDNGDETKRQQWVTKAEDTIHEIEQFLGTADNVDVMKWRGELNYVKGNSVLGIRQMSEAYDQLQATDKSDAMLSYVLSKAMETRPEIGMRKMYLESAIFRKRESMAMYKPTLLLDYADLMLNFRQWKGTQTSPGAIIIATMFEDAYGINDRSAAILVKGYAGAGQFEDAQEKLKELPENGSEYLSLKRFLLKKQIDRIFQETRASQIDQLDTQTTQQLDPAKQEQINQYKAELAAVTEKLLNMAPEKMTLDQITDTCNYYVSQNNKDKALELINIFLENEPDNITAKIYKYDLNEPEPDKISQERQDQITMKVLSDITDDLDRYVSLGSHYQSAGLPEKALESFKQAYEIDSDDKEVIEAYFTAAIIIEDSDLAMELAQKARQLNIDLCDGNFFAAHVDFMNAKYNDALARIDECLKIRPVFSAAYLLRSRIDMALEQVDLAVEDIKTASRMNPLDGAVAKQLVLILNERNKQPGYIPSLDEQNELERALIMAMLLNPNEWQLRSLYAEYISDKDPSRALAIRQDLQRIYPTAANHLLLGRMAVKMAAKEGITSRKQALLDLAGSAFKKAYELEPGNQDIQNSYSEYLRLTDQQEQAAALFSGQDEVMWRFYLRDGQYDKCAEILEKLYDENPKDTTTLQALITLSKLTDQRENLKRYTEELLAVEDTANNQLLQIQVYLEAGLVKEADLKLASFKERKPDDTRGNLLDAWAKMKLGQLNKAMEQVNKTLAAEPENAMAWRLRGQLNILQGKLGEGISDLEKSKSLNAAPDIRIALAQAYFQAGRSTEAISELTIASKDEQAPQRVWTLLEEFYIKSDRTNDLKKFYNENLAKRPDNVYWNMRAGRLALSEKDYPQAEQLIQKAWQLSTKQGGNMEALDAYLETLWLQGKYEQLLKLAADYIDTDFAPVAYSQMAQTQFKMGNTDKAVDYYSKALEKVGGNDVLIMAILKNMSDIIGIDHAINWCTSELNTNPNSIAANMTMFNISQQKGQYNKAIEYINKCINTVDSQSNDWTAYSIKKVNALTAAYVKTSDQTYLDSSISEYRKILDIQPSNNSVLNNLAYLLADNNRELDKAVEYGKKAHDLSPNNPGNMDTYGYVLCKSGNFTEAEEILQMAIQAFDAQGSQVPWDVYEHLAMAKEGLGDTEQALALYKRAMETAGSQLTDTNKERLDKNIERLSK